MKKGKSTYWKDLFFRDITPKITHIKRGVVVGEIGGGQIGSTKINPTTGYFDYHVRKRSENFLQWRFPTQDAADEYFLFQAHGQVRMANGRGSYDVIPLVVDNFINPGRYSIVHTDIDRFKYLFGNRSDKFYERIYKLYKQVGII